MKTNKFKINLSWLILSLIILTSFACDSNILDEEPKTFLSEATVFSSRSGAIAATSGIYAPFKGNSLYGWWLLGSLEMLSDYIYGRGSQAPMGRYQFDAQSVGRVGNVWRGGYSVVNRANTVIFQLENNEIEGVDAELKNRLIGEARFLRALAYFHMVRLFGDLPLRVEPEVSDFAIARTSETEVYNQIIADLEFSEQNLPDEYPTSDLGRATKWAAISLLSKVYLTLENWSEAANKANEVIESDQFSLVEVEEPKDFQMIFGPDIVTHSEEIFSLKHARIAGLGFSPLWLMHRAGSGYSLGSNAHAWYGNLDSWLGSWVQEIEGPDLRPKDWLYNGEHDEQFLSDEIPMLFKKFRDTEADPPGNDFPVIRYTEVLLIFAEAETMAMGTPTSKAYEMANMVKRRAFGRDLNSPDAEADFAPGMSSEEFQDAILQERAKEFVMEGKRWYDLVRTGKAIEIIKSSGPVKANFEEKYLKWPIPAEEIDNNDLMTQENQNPQW